MISAQSYSILIRMRTFEEEECYEAKVLEFPDLIEYADTHEEAYELIIDAIETTQIIFTEKNKEIPVPSTIIDDSYSGRVTLRMPKELHKNIAISANQDGASLNQYLVFLLSFYQGYNSSINQVKDSIEKMQSSIEEGFQNRSLSISIDYKANELEDNLSHLTLDQNCIDKQLGQVCLYSI